jgi:hypothetical protein
MAALPRVARRSRRGQGQVVVIFALAITVLFAAAGLAFDIGRFYSERRFLQNAADAAALAAGSALIRGETPAQADIRAREVLAANFANSPSGVAPAMPPSTPVYADSHAGQPAHLINGILISGGEVRVAIQNGVDYTFGRIVGLDRSTIGGQARVLTQGKLLPVAVRQYVNLPGPNAVQPVTCPEDQNEFMDFFATAATSCLGSETDSARRMEPTAGAAFNVGLPADDPTHHGPVVAILGQGAQPNNGADFRGFIALDVRNFQAVGTQLYYNEVTATTSDTALKGIEANWVTIGGYPGPLFPPAVNPPDPNDQVLIMNGNSTGVVIDKFLQRYQPGREIMIAVYPGNVMAIPDFSMTPPTTIALPTTGFTLNAGSMKISRNQSFSGTVDLSTLTDDGDPLNPYTVGTLLGSPPPGSPPITYTPNPVTPSLGSGQTVNLMNVTTLGATPGIYTLWIYGEAGSPYLTKKWEPLPINVGGVLRDFTITADATTNLAVNAGDTVEFSLNIKRNGPSWGGNTVTLSVDGPLPTGMLAPTFSRTSVTPSSGVGETSKLTINTGTMAPGRYRLIVRTTGLNGETATGHPVTHLLQLWIDVATGGSGHQEYVDIVGFAVMRITDMNANTINAYAITPVIPDPNDSRLLRGQAAKLVPWN